MDVIANNLSNSSSPGYKGEHMMFAEHVKNTGRTSKISFVHDIAMARNMRAGELEPTKNTLDVAIKGEGWFQVDTIKGPRYTRNGHFELNSKGILVNTAGHPVQGEGGAALVGAGGENADATQGTPIAFEPGDTKIVIKSDGTITANGKARGKLKVVAFSEPGMMKKVSGNLFSSESDRKPNAENSIVQGMLERSNVQPIIEITNMISALRGYQSTQKLIDKEHERQRTAIEKLTRET